MAYPPYQMKGPALYKKPLYKKSKGKKNITTKPTDYDKRKEELIAQGFTPADADKMIQDGATTGDSGLPFLGGLLSKGKDLLSKGIGKVKDIGGKALMGSDGKFGWKDAGRLALGGPLVGGALGLMKKGKKPNLPKSKNY